jgi:hypothetical protein
VPLVQRALNEAERNAVDRKPACGHLFIADGIRIRFVSLIRPGLSWGNPIPSVTVIDPDGVVAGMFVQPPVDDELETPLSELSS